ncbi:response regulator [Egbenema bharatensis]|uniref:response regulator n=1 Tax=Egbenema bharatensis TaxID=3463334 RepID=UPI003A867356
MPYYVHQSDSCCVSQSVSSSTYPLILVVEDDDDNLLLIRYVLESFGYRFVGQKDSRKALATVKEYQPDLILMDVLLPDVDGIQLVKHLKQDEITEQIPVIAVTALAKTEDRESLLLAGFADYISKPYMLEDLEAAIRRHLR